MAGGRIFAAYPAAWFRVNRLAAPLALRPCGARESQHTSAARYNIKAFVWILSPRIEEELDAVAVSSMNASFG